MDGHHGSLDDLEGRFPAGPVVRCQVVGLLDHGSEQRDAVQEGPDDVGEITPIVLRQDEIRDVQLVAKLGSPRGREARKVGERQCVESCRKPLAWVVIRSIRLIHHGSRDPAGGSAPDRARRAARRRSAIT